MIITPVRRATAPSGRCGHFSDRPGGLVAPRSWSSSTAIVAPRSRGGRDRAASVDSGDLMAGDIVTVRADTGHPGTHRVSAWGPSRGRFFELKGDANATPDRSSSPPGGDGPGRRYLPLAGYALAMLSTPSGLVSVLAGLGMLHVCIWLLEGHRGGDPQRGSGQRPPRRRLMGHLVVARPRCLLAVLLLAHLIGAAPSSPGPCSPIARTTPPRSPPRRRSPTSRHPWSPAVSSRRPPPTCPDSSARAAPTSCTPT